MDEKLLKELRHRAVDERLSLSAWIVRTLAGRATKESEREKVRTRALSRIEKGFHLGGKPLTREEAHARR
jgi:hypothetical protein